MKKKIKRSEYKGKIARVPYTFVHSMGHIWAIQNKRVKDYNLEWACGKRRYELYEPFSLSPLDMQNYLALLHVLQHPRDFGVIQDIYSEDKYKMTLKMRALYEVLRLPTSGNFRSDLRKSLQWHADSRFRVIDPGTGSRVTFYGMGLHNGRLEFDGKGRGGGSCVFHIDKALIDNSGITENVSRVISYKTGLAKLIDFLVMSKLDQGVNLSYNDWMKALTREGRIDNFKRDFEPALEEISARDFLVELREDGMKIKYCGSKQKALSLQNNP